MAMWGCVVWMCGWIDELNELITWELTNNNNNDDNNDDDNNDDGKVSFRSISASSGEELGGKARELLHHFRRHGTPVMMGRSR